MKEVGTVTRGEWSYPVLLDEEGCYRIDLGGAFGVSEPFKFATSADAISFFARKLEEEDY